MVCKTINSRYRKSSSWGKEKKDLHFKSRRSPKLLIIKVNFANHYNCSRCIIDHAGIPAAVRQVSIIDCASMVTVGGIVLDALNEA